VTPEATLTLRAPLRQRVDASTVAWATLTGLMANEVGAQKA